MRNLILIFLILLGVNITAQKKDSSNIHKSFIFYNNIEVYKWEGITRNNIIVFGVAPSEYKAKSKIDDFNTRNWNTNYRMVHYTIEKDSVKQIGKEGYFIVYKRRFPKGYYLLTVQEQLATEIYMKQGLYDAIEYYRKAKKIPYPTSKSHLENLLYNLSQYRINFSFYKEDQNN